jgi:hypothetical protein
MHAELGVHVRKVGFDRALADEQLLGDFPSRLPLGRQPGHLPLPAAQRRRAKSGRGGSPSSTAKAAKCIARTVAAPDGAAGFEGLCGVLERVKRRSPITADQRSAGDVERASANARQPDAERRATARCAASASPQHANPSAAKA